MANDQNSGDKTEPATAKRLRDARKRGDVPKSKDLTGTLGLAFSLVLIVFAMAQGVERLAALFDVALRITDQPFRVQLLETSDAAISTFLLLSALILLPIAAFGMLVEFLQTGPILALEKIQPKLENLDPAAGVKKMFSMDNFVELLKSIGKTVILLTIAWLVIDSAMIDLVSLPANQPMAIVAAVQSLGFNLLGWTLGVFLIIMAMDVSYQQYSYAKKMRMSIRDIKQEHKDNEGDPMMKGQRRQLQQEWAQESGTQAARSASVLVVNPTHIAIAILYDKEDNPVPTVTAKGQDEHARSMRDAANEANVPVLRNQALARQLLADVDEGDVVPRELFDIVAEVISWARGTREHIEHRRAAPAVPAAGEDLTRYPPGLDYFGAKG